MAEMTFLPVYEINVLLIRKLSLGNRYYLWDSGMQAAFLAL